MKKKQIPNWLYLAAVPGLGWTALLFAGYQAKQRDWLLAALICGALSVTGLVTGIEGLVSLGWLAAILHLYVMRESYQTYYRLVANPTYKTPTTLGVDLNQATKDQLVYQLNLPITQANKILELRKSGVVFTSIEELAGYTGIALTRLRAVEPIMIFAYHEFGNAYEKWQRINTLNAAEISQAFQLPPELSQRLVQERDQNGLFHSLVELRQRSALPYDQLGKLL